MCIKILEYGGKLEIASYFLSSSMGLRALRALTGFTGPVYGTLRATGSTGARALRAAYGTTGPTGPEGPYSNLNHDRTFRNFGRYSRIFTSVRKKLYKQLCTKNQTMGFGRLVPTGSCTVKQHLNLLSHLASIASLRLTWGRRLC